MKKLLEFLQSNGEFSSTRLFMLLVCISFIFNWIYAIIVYSKFEPSLELLIFVASILGFKIIEGFKK